MWIDERTDKKKALPRQLRPQLALHRKNINYPRPYYTKNYREQQREVRIGQNIVPLVAWGVYYDRTFTVT